MLDCSWILDVLRNRCVFSISWGKDVAQADNADRSGRQHPWQIASWQVTNPPQPKGSNAALPYVERRAEDQLE